MNQRSAKPEPRYWPSEERNNTTGSPYNRLRMKNCNRKGPEIQWCAKKQQTTIRQMSRMRRMAKMTQMTQMSKVSKVK